MAAAERRAGGKKMDALLQKPIQESKRSILENTRRDGFRTAHRVECSPQHFAFQIWLRDDDDKLYEPNKFSANRAATLADIVEFIGEVIILATGKMDDDDALSRWAKFTAETIAGNLNLDAISSENFKNAVAELVK